MGRSLVDSGGRLGSTGSLLEQSVDADRGRRLGRVEQGDYVLDASLVGASQRTECRSRRRSVRLTSLKSPLSALNMLTV